MSAMFDLPRAVASLKEPAMESNSPPVPKPAAVANWYFTFGHGQHHFGRYVKINGTFNEAREEMIHRFGYAWSMQYDEDKALPTIKEWSWTELK